MYMQYIYYSIAAIGFDSFPLIILSTFGEVGMVYCSGTEPGTLETSIFFFSKWRQSKLLRNRTRDFGNLDFFLLKIKTIKSRKRLVIKIDKLPLARLTLSFRSVWLHHKRRIYTEKKAKVVAADALGTELLKFLAALAILYQDD